MENGIELELITQGDRWEDIEWLHYCPICNGTGSLYGMVFESTFDLDDYDLQDALDLIMNDVRKWLDERFAEFYSADEHYYDSEFETWVLDLTWEDFDFENDDDLENLLIPALVALDVIEYGDFDATYDGTCQYCDDGVNDSLMYSYAWETYVAGTDTHEAAKTARRNGCYLFGDDYTWYICFQGGGQDSSWTLAYGAYKTAGYLQDHLTPDSIGGSVFLRDDERKELADAILEKLDYRAEWVGLRNQVAELADKPTIKRRISLLEPKLDYAHDVLVQARGLEKYAIDARADIYEQWAMQDVPLAEVDPIEAFDVAIQRLQDKKRAILRNRKTQRQEVRRVHRQAWLLMWKQRILNFPLVKFCREVGTKK